jgi:hypothetical protein
MQVVVGTKAVNSNDYILWWILLRGRWSCSRWNKSGNKMCDPLSGRRIMGDSFFYRHVTSLRSGLNQKN